MVLGALVVQHSVPAVSSELADAVAGYESVGARHEAWVVTADAGDAAAGRRLTEYVRIRALVLTHMASATGLLYHDADLSRQPNTHLLRRSASGL